MAECVAPLATARIHRALSRPNHFMAERGHCESQHALILTCRPPEPRRSAMARYDELCQFIRFCIPGENQGRRE